MVIQCPSRKCSKTFERLRDCMSHCNTEHKNEKFRKGWVPWCDCHLNTGLNRDHHCRYFGSFECPCGRTWKSGFTWKFMSQDCTRCGKKCYAKDCRDLEKSEQEVAKDKPHHEAECEKCKKLGHNCTINRK